MEKNDGPDPGELVEIAKKFEHIEKEFSDWAITSFCFSMLIRIAHRQSYPSACFDQLIADLMEEREKGKAAAMWKGKKKS